MASLVAIIHSLVPVQLLLFLGGGVDVVVELLFGVD